jgi:hydrogenase maturation protein HypF
MLRAAAQGLQSPWTSSMGRLFDAAAALILGVGEVSSEGEAAGWLESCAASHELTAYPLPLDFSSDASLPRGDWRPLFRALGADIRRGVAPPLCAARFHNALANHAASIAEHCPLPDVVISGGCFLNLLLTDRVLAALRRRGRRVYRHSLLPPGDGGLAAGQLAVALAGR